MGLGAYMVPFAGDTLWGHSGQTIGYNSSTYFHPCRKFSISVIMNDTYKNLGSIMGGLVTGILDELVVLGTDEVYSESTELLMYPNPIRNGIVTISLPKNEDLKEIKVLDVNGKVVVLVSKVISSTYRLDASRITPGIYVVVSESNKKLYLEKLIVQ